MREATLKASLILCYLCLELQKFITLAHQTNLPLQIPAYLLHLYKNIGGSANNFPLTVRIFHSVLILSMAALIYNIPVNLFVGLPYIASACVLTLFLVAGVYYISRYQGKTTLARLIFCLTATTLFVANYFMNSGIDGPTGYFFILMMVIMVAIVPVSQYWYWVGSNVLIIFGLHLIQYYHPEWVPYTYKDLADRYFDNTSAYLTVVIVVLTCFYIIRKRYDAERLQAQQNAMRLQELDVEKNKLFSIVSHDLRSPLANIQGYLELLTECEMSDEERHQIQAQLLSSTRGTLEMVNNVLHWSKHQMTGGQSHYLQLEAEAVLATQVDMAVDIAARKQIKLEARLHPETLIWGNADMVQLIVRNLLNNAIKFTSSGGSVTLSATKENGQCLISVCDSGNGHPAQLTEAVFHLSGASTAGTANEKGVGLGLVLCRENTEALGGRIWFSCGEHSGTTFYVALPAAAAS